MAQLPELRPVHITRVDFLYVTVNDNTWKRLPLSNNNYTHNCYGVDFDDGVILTQSDRCVGSICRLKLILKSPLIGTEDDLLSIEAECVDVQEPSFDARPRSRDKAEAIEQAKIMPLASLSSDITAVKLKNLGDISLGGKDVIYDYIVRERIRDVIDRGYQAYMDAARITNGLESKLWTLPPPEPGNSLSNVSPYKPQSEEQQSSLQATATRMATPQPSSSSSNYSLNPTRSEDDPSTPQATTTTPMTTTQPSGSSSSPICTQKKNKDTMEELTDLSHRAVTVATTRRTITGRNIELRTSSSPRQRSDSSTSDVYPSSTPSLEEQAFTPRNNTTSPPRHSRSSSSSSWGPVGPTRDLHALGERFKAQQEGTAEGEERLSTGIGG